MANNAAFEILYKEYYVRIFGLCRRLLNSSELAEDAAQETFMRAYKSFRKYNTDQPFWQWIATIANNHCIDVLRKQTRTEALFGDEAVEAAELEGSDEPFGSVLAHEDAERINVAVANLPDKYRVPLVLAFFSQLSYDEIAEQMDVAKNHVGVLIVRGKQKLRAELVTGEVA